MSKPFPRWLLDDRSALINSMKEYYYKLKSSDIKWQKRKVTERLLLEMKDFFLSKGIAFYVVLLEMREEPSLIASYINFFENEKINFINCLTDKSMTKEMRVPHEGLGVTQRRPRRPVRRLFMKW